MLHKLIDIITSLKLTIICLAAAMALIFAGTLAQVHLGIHEAQQRYFQSIFVWWPPEGRGFRIPIFPGGHLIGAVLLVNLIAAHIKRFRWTWRKLGIHLTHAGLIIMLAGGLFTDLFAVESHMRLTNGDTKNYSEDMRDTELAVIDTSGDDLDQVTAIPESVLRHNRVIDERDVPSAAVEILPKDGGSLGTWLVSDALGAPQTFACGGRTWMITLRPARYYKPYSVTLQKFTHEKYAGTEIPKNFSSKVTLVDPERSVGRDVLIYMNHPLRYRGETFYQAGFQPDDSATILQVVHNPSFIAPYLACVIVAAGLLVQFGFHLVGFSRQRRRTVA